MTTTRRQHRKPPTHGVSVSRRQALALGLNATAAFGAALLTGSHAHAAPRTAPVHTRADAIAAAAAALTSRERAGFVWPSRVLGTEPFFGRDTLLTFDVLPEPDLVRALTQHDLTATVFLRPDVTMQHDAVRAMHAAGFDFGYHAVEAEWDAEYAAVCAGLAEAIGRPVAVQFVRPAPASDPNAWAMWVDGHGLTDVGRGFVPDPKHDDLDTVAAYRAHPHHGRIVSVGDDEALGWLRHRLGGLLELTEHQGGRMTCLHGMA